MPAQSGNNFQAMEKADTVGGGAPHTLTVVQPRQGTGDKIPKYIERKGDKPLNTDVKQNDFVNKVQEKRRRDKQDSESVVEPPLEAAASIGGYVQSMEKGFNLQNNDALVRGGDLDKEKELPEDILLDEKEVEKTVRKAQEQSTAQWFRDFLLTKKL